MNDDISPMLALAHRVRRGDRATLLEAKTLANHLITLAGRLEAAERARDLLIEMSISSYRSSDQSMRYRLETAITGTEYFAARESAVARLLDVAGVTDDTTTEAAR